MRGALLVSLFGAGLALAGCSGVGTVNNVFVDSAYSIMPLNSAVRDRAVPVVVVGQPLPGATPEAALAPIRLPQTVAAERLQLVSDSVIRLVLFFDQSGGTVTSTTACSPTPAHGALITTPGVLTVTAAYCVGERINSLAASSTPQPDSLADPRYAQTVENALLAILPIDAPRLGSGLPFLFP